MRQGMLGSRRALKSGSLTQTNRPIAWVSIVGSNEAMEEGAYGAIIKTKCWQRGLRHDSERSSLYKNSEDPDGTSLHPHELPLHKGPAQHFLSSLYFEHTS